MASWRFRFSSARRAALEALACAATAPNSALRASTTSLVRSVSSGCADAAPAST
jgi:hypothetical protein